MTFKEIIQTAGKFEAERVFRVSLEEAADLPLGEPASGVDAGWCPAARGGRPGRGGLWVGALGRLPRGQLTAGKGSRNH